MCFSATASFTATALLLPASIYAGKLALDRDKRYLPLATVPFAFAVQQSIEGVEWLFLGQNSVESARLAALGFLAFSHWFWLVWPAAAVWAMEHRPWVQKFCLGMMVVGFGFGVSLYLPFWLKPDWLAIAVTQGSIDYQIHLIYDAIFSRDIFRLIYLLIVVSPMCLSQLRQLKVLAGLVALSVIVTYCFLNYAFASVWCFFAALLSLYIIKVIHSVPHLEVSDSK